MSMGKISKLLSVDIRRIKKILINNNISIRDNSFYRKKDINECYFESIDTEEKAYILGFIYADGCITKGNTLKIGLSIKDISMLHIIKNKLCSDHNIGIYENNNGFHSEVNNQYCVLSIANKAIYNTLVQCGLFERKSKTQTFPNSNIVGYSLIRHFIRGYFDGDGSVYNVYPKNCKSTICVSFTGSLGMIDKIKDILSVEIESNSQIHEYSKSLGTYDYKIGGSNNIKKLYSYLYKEATIFLGRKKDMFDEYLNL